VGVGADEQRDEVRVEPGRVDLDHLGDTAVVVGSAGGDHRVAPERAEQQVAGAGGGFARQDRQRPAAFQLAERHRHLPWRP
jgi:hypothetical protein